VSRFSFLMSCGLNQNGPRNRTTSHEQIRFAWRRGSFCLASRSLWTRRLSRHRLASFARQTPRLRDRLPSMLVNRLGLKKKLRAALAFTLVLWCAGAGCMLVSYAHDASMANPEVASAPANGSTWTGVSASAGTHSCCRARHSSQHGSPANSHRPGPLAAGSEEVALPESSNSSETMNCCPLTSGTFLVTARQSVSGDHVSAAPQSDAPTFVLAHVDATPRALPLRLPNQNQTYLRCCSFLI
jgi:hypothetical protein